MAHDSLRDLVAVRPGRRRRARRAASEASAALDQADLAVSAGDVIAADAPAESDSRLASDSGEGERADLAIAVREANPSVVTLPAESSPSEAPEPGTGGPGTSAAESAVIEAIPAVDRWRATLRAARLPNTLIGDDFGIELLDLTHAHPSGVATLMAGRSTRLSSLVREPAAHAAARRRARMIAASSERLSVERGVRSGYLAAGLASWTDGPSAAPVLMRTCHLLPRGAGQDDYELDLDDTAVVNPELVRRLREFDIDLDASALGSLAFGSDGFDPAPVYRVLEDICSLVPRFRIDRSLIVGSFTAGSDALIADLDAARLALGIHPLLGRTANVTQSMDRPDLFQQSETAQTDVDWGQYRPFVAADPEPETDDCPFDLDSSQRAALDAALDGLHVVIEGPPGSGLTHTLIATVTTLVGRGRRALIVSPHRETVEQIGRRLHEAGLGDLVLDLHDGIGDRRRILEGLRNDLTAALADQGEAASAGHKSAEAEAVAAAQIRFAATGLASAGAALHRKHHPWGVSAYDAMAALAELMASDRPPRTRVRLPMAVCQTLDVQTRESLREDLRAVAELGAFHQTRVDTRWLDARIADENEAAEALAAVTAGRNMVPKVRELMIALAESAGLEPADSLAEWRPQLDLLLDLREILDVLRPSVFDVSLTELIAATAEGENDDSFDGAMGMLARRTARRRAKALVRPGLRLPNLHQKLVTAADLRDRWRAMAPPNTAPTVPTGLDAANAAVSTLELAIARLAPVLEGTGTPPFEAMPAEKLRDRLADLAADEKGLLAQPMRRDRMKRLKSAGLQPLLDDLNFRRPEPEDVDGELDLAWWTSVLETIIRSDRVLAEHDQSDLRRHIETLRDAQRRLMAARAGQLMAGTRLRALGAVADHPQQAAWLKAEVDGAQRSSWPMDALSMAGDVVASLRPIWIMSPDAVARNLPPARPGLPMIDVVAVDDASQVGMPESAAALARAQQVIIAGDRRRLPPATGGPSVIHAVAQLAGSVESLSLTRLDRDHRSRDGRLLGPLRGSYPQPWALTPGAAALCPLTLSHVQDAAGVPAPGEEVVTTSPAEVQRVVELVAEHAVRRPGESLLIVTLGGRHAARIEDALRAEVAYRPELARWLEVHWAGDISEPFLVRPIHRVPGVERDAVIVAIGLARTPHGRVLHRFGVLDGTFGEACLITALSRARRRTTVVCGFTAEDLEPARLRSDGARLLRRTLEMAAEPRLRGDHIDIGKLPDSGDPLIRDFRDRLETAGLPVVAGPEGLDWPLAAAVADPELPGQRLLAVDIDGPGYASCPSVAARDRQRRETLERTGWTYARTAAMDLFCDPAGEVERIKTLWRDVLGAPTQTAPTHVIVGRPRSRGPFPEGITAGRPVTQYSDEALESVALWVLSDGTQRSPDELAAQVREALHLPRRGLHVEAAVGGAARRVLDGGWSAHSRG